MEGERSGEVDEEEKEMEGNEYLGEEREKKAKAIMKRKRKRGVEGIKTEQR